MRRIVLIGAIVVAVLIVGVLVFALAVDANQFRPAIESELSRSLGREVKIGDLKLNIFPGAVTASDLSVADDPSFSNKPFLRTKAVSLSIDLLNLLFSRKLKVNGITFDIPFVALIQSPSGVWNFSSLGAKTAAQPGAGSSNGSLALSVKSLKINGAKVSLAQGSGEPQVLDNVTIEVKDFAPGSAFSFSLSAKTAGGGDVSLDGNAGPIDPADSSNTPLTATLKITGLNLAASGVVPASSGIEGVVSMDGMAKSNGRTLDLTGTVKAEKLVLAPHGKAAQNPLQFDVALAEDLKQRSGQLSRGDATIGTVKAGLTGTWTQQGDATVLKMMLAAPSEPVNGLVELLPALDIVLPSGSTPEGGTAAANLTVAGPLSGLAIGGPVSVRDTRLKGFDMGAKMSTIEKLAGLKSGPNTEVQTLSANLRMTPEGTSLQDIHLVLPSVGELTGGGTISPNHALDFKMRATVRASALSVLTPPNIPFTIGGTSSNPQFRPDVGQLATEEITRGLNGAKVGGVDVGKTAGDALQGLFGGKKKK
jgi:AsmA protein